MIVTASQADPNASYLAGMLLTGVVVPVVVLVVGILLVRRSRAARWRWDEDGDATQGRSQRARPFVGVVLIVLACLGLLGNIVNIVRVAVS